MNYLKENSCINKHNKKIQFSNKESLIKYLLGDTYFQLSDKERVELLIYNAFAKCLNTEYKPVTITKSNIDTIDNEKNFLIYDENTYILSLLLLNKIMLLERKDSNIFASNIDKSKLDGNYIILNTFAKKLLADYIEKLKNNIK